MLEKKKTSFLPYHRNCPEQSQDYLDSNALIWCLNHTHIQNKISLEIHLVGIRMPCAVKKDMRGWDLICRCLCAYIETVVPGYNVHAVWRPLDILHVHKIHCKPLQQNIRICMINAYVIAVASFDHCYVFAVWTCFNAYVAVRCVRWNQEKKIVPFSEYLMWFMYFMVHVDRFHMAIRSYTHTHTHKSAFSPSSHSIQNHVTSNSATHIMFFASGLHRTRTNGNACSEIDACHAESVVDRMSTRWCSKLTQRICCESGAHCM